MSPNYYSPHYTADTPTALVGTSQDDPPFFIEPGLRHGTVRHSHALIDISGTTLATTEQLRMLSMKSSDRLIEAYLTNTHTGTALTFDVGLYEIGANHDGADKDKNLIATITDGTVATRTALFADILSDLDRGKTLWELLGESEDPQVLYDVVLTAVTVTGVTEGSSLLEVEFLHGGG